MAKIFIGVVLINLLAYIAWFFMPFASGYLYDYDTLDLLSFSGFGAKIDLDGPIPYVIGLIYVVTTFGLLLFKSWARIAFSTLAVFTIISPPLWGVSIQGSYDVMIGSLVSITDGAIISMAFFTSISNDFSKSGT